MTGVDRRIAERRRQVRVERRQRRLRRTVVLATVAALAAVVVVVERSFVVALAEVVVVGTQRLDPARVRAAAALEPGTSTLRLDLDGAEQRVERLPLVADAEARRRDPLTVVVSVTEREPALVGRVGDDAVVVDAAGVILSAGAAADVPAELPLVVLPATAPLPPPGETVTALPGLANAQAALQALSGPLAARVARAEAAVPDDVTLVLTDGTRVRIGRAQRMDEKVRALGAVLEDLGTAGATVVDVRAPAAPTVVP